FAAAWDDVLAGGGGEIEDDCVGFNVGVFDHDDGISALWDGGTGHDLSAGAGRDGNFGGVTRFEFADAFKSRSGRNFAGANGKTVANRAVKGRIRAVGANFLGEDAAERHAY